MTEDLSGDSNADRPQSNGDCGGNSTTVVEMKQNSETGDMQINEAKELITSIKMQEQAAGAATTTTIERNNNNNNTLSLTTTMQPTLFSCNNPAHCVTLKNILESFKNPIHEEQAWALIYQFIALYRNMVVTGTRQVFADHEIPTGIEHLSLHYDGSVHCTRADNIRKTNSSRELQQRQQRQSRFHKDMERLRGAYSHAEIIASHEQVLHRLALIVYTALDYNLPQYEECTISEELEELITHMTTVEQYKGKESNDEADESTIDEGIEDETNDEQQQQQQQQLIDSNMNNSDKDQKGSSVTTKIFDYVLEICRKHLQRTNRNHVLAADHFRAVCRAFVAETNDLRIFLQHVSKSNETQTSFHSKINSDANKLELVKMGFIDWARFWVQVINELRRGVILKKANYVRPNIHYERTPYEVLMEDIRARKYQLRKVMVNGDIPPRMKKDTHTVILEYIRSRPPLRRASEQKKLLPPIKLTPSPRELLLDSIRKLKHTQPATPRRLFFNESNANF